MPIYKDKQRDTYYFAYTKVVNGKRIQKCRRGFQTKNEAKIAEIESQNNLLKGVNDSLSLYAVYDEFVNNTKSNIKPSSLNKYDQFKRNYLSLIPDKAITKLNVKDINVFKKNITSRNLSPSHVNKFIGIMRNFLSYCNLIYNVSGSLQLPLMETYKVYSVKEENKKEVYIPPQDFEKLTDLFIKENDIDFYYYAILHTLYYTGLRIGELAALTINDLKKDYINVNKDYMKVSGKVYILAPKTENSIRKVYLDNRTIDILNEYVNRFKPTNIVFRLESEYLNQQRLRRVLANALKNSGLDSKYDLHLHSLRHSHASYLRELGYDEFLIAARLGNTPKVSAKTYIHTSNEELRKIAKNIK